MKTGKSFSLCSKNVNKHKESAILVNHIVQMADVAFDTAIDRKILQFQLKKLRKTYAERSAMGDNHVWKKDFQFHFDEQIATIDF